MGTPDYVAPEQVQGKAIDGSADQYSLGCVAYQCLTGMPPFRRDSDMAVLWAHVNDQRPPVVVALPGVSTAELSRAIGRAMAKIPSDRFATCSDFVTAVADSAHRADQAGPAVDRTLGSSWSRTRWRWWGAAAALLVASVGVIAWALLAPNEGTPGPPAPARSTPGLAGLPRGVNRLDMSSNRSVANVPVENTTIEVAIGGGFVWATDHTGLAKVNLQTNTQVENIPGRYLSIVGGPDGVWAFDPDVGIVSIDAATNDRRPVASVVEGVSDLRSGDGYIWYTNARGHNPSNANVGVFRVDPETGKTRSFHPTSVPGGCTLEACERSILALGDGAAWYLNDAGTVTRMDTTTGEDQLIPVPKARGWRSAMVTSGSCSSTGRRSSSWIPTGWSR